MGWTDLITLKELSPELRELIMAGGGEGVISGSPIFIDSVYTKKVVATEQDQVEFEIPFEEFDTVNSYLDVKINSTWINPDRYSIEGSRVTLNDGVDIGTVVYFTIFSLAQVTPDGGYIQDVDIAETPQEVIIYDDSIIDEKVSAHNDSEVAHEDIRELIANQIKVLSDQITWKPIEWKTEDALPSDYPTSRTTIFLSGAHTFNGFANCIVRTVCNFKNTCTQFIDGGYDMMPICYRQATPEGKWLEWKTVVTTDITSNLDDKIGVLEQITTVPPDKTDLNTLVTTRQSYVLNPINSPTNRSGYLIVTRLNNNYVAQLFFGKNNITFTRVQENGVWSKWETLATTSKINNLTLTNGWEAWSSDVGYKQVSKSGNIVSLLLFVKNKSATNLSPIVLPTEYRPLGSIAIHFVGQNKEIYLGGIRTDGQIYLDEQVPANVGVCLNCSWVV